MILTPHVRKTKSTCGVLIWGCLQWKPTALRNLAVAQFEKKTSYPLATGMPSASDNDKWRKYPSPAVLIFIVVLRILVLNLRR